MSRSLTSDTDIRDLLLGARTIAVVGLSDSPDRPSFEVAMYLRDVGYEVIPVNPNLAEWQGLRAYPALGEIGKKVDIVDVFRRPEFVDVVVDDAIASGAGSLWTQLGVVNLAATGKALAAGMPAVINRCIAVEHRRLVGPPGSVR